MEVKPYNGEKSLGENSKAGHTGKYMLKGQRRFGACAASTMPHLSTTTTCLCTNGEKNG